jgi:hypothetical protein
VQTPEVHAPVDFDLTALMLQIVAEKTGYPVDMLDLGMDLEGDLGIDSIKRVEILAAVDDRAPGLPKFDRSAMSALHTVGEIVGVTFNLFDDEFEKAAAKISAFISFTSSSVRPNSFFFLSIPLISSSSIVTIATSCMIGRSLSWIVSLTASNWAV